MTEAKFKSKAGRELNPKLIKILDKRLEGNKAALEIVANKDNYSPSVKKKRAREFLGYLPPLCVGVREIPKNSNKGPEVSLYQDVTGTEESADAWCMRFVQVLIAYVEYKLDIDSPLYASGSCWRVWTKTPLSQRVKVRPAKNAIIIWQNGNGIKQGSSGHTGFMMEMSEDGKSMITIEGNTNAGLAPNGDIVNEGGGVYRSERKVIMHDGKHSKKQKLVGFLKPF